ncbi:MAG: hypothetical protein JKY66_05840 [Spongiibacteraceae bacterium]|nr:hypothetical protein [Spongiibacteraceae bacterium]
MTKFVKGWLDRRHFLSSMASASVILSVSYSGLGATVAQALSRADGVFNSAQRDSLQRLFYLMFPFPEVGSAPYKEAVDALAGSAISSAQEIALVVDGLKKLDTVAGSPWFLLKETAQVEVMEKLQESEFFQRLYGFAIDHLMNHKMVWKTIGYEGSSIEYGGYRERGLDDIKWVEKFG